MFLLAVAAAGSVQADDLAASPGRFRFGVAAFLGIALLDVAVAWALHQVLRVAEPAWSRLAAWFRLAYAAVLVVGVGLLLGALELTAGTSRAAAAATTAGSGIGDLASGLVGAFASVWAIGLACFGCHLLAVGALLTRARLAPRPLGPALMVAGLAYLIDTLARIALPGYHSLGTVFTVLVAVPALSELVLAVWLLTPAARRQLEA